MRIWKRLALIAFVVALVTTPVGYVVWKSYPTKFRAHALLQVAAHSPRVMLGSGESEADVDYNRFKQTQQALVKSRLVLATVLVDKNVRAYRVIRDQTDPNAWLQDNLEVRFIADSEVMEIALSGDDPIEIAGLVNAVAKAYVDAGQSVDSRRRAERHAQLQQIKIKYDDMLKDRRQRPRADAGRGLDQMALDTEIAALEDVAQKIGTELQALAVELDAPPRVRTIENAVPPSAPSRGTLWGRLTSR